MYSVVEVVLFGCVVVAAYARVLSDYLKELCDEGLVQKTIDKKALALRMLWRVYPVYVVPKSRRKRLNEIRDKREIYEFIDSASPEEMRKLHEKVKHLRETEEKQ
jgi:hypothetical protein